MEKWKQITGYSLYQVSTKGRIKSFKNSKERILKPKENSKGYLRVALVRDDGKKKLLFVHRLVAETFIPHKRSLNVVNHLDFNPLNNDVKNLEWTTQKENMRYSFKAGRFARTDEWRNRYRQTCEKKGRSVIGTSIEYEKEMFFICLNDVKTKGFQASCVCNCCKGIRKTHKGYTWRYATPQEIERLKQQWNTQ